MELDIPIREVKIYQSADGLKIEEHTTTLHRKIEINESDIDKVNTSHTLYYGSASLDSPMGPQEIKFPIEAKDLKDAFSEFVPTIEKLMEEMQSQIIDPTDNEIIY